MGLLILEKWGGTVNLARESLPRWVLGSCVERLRDLGFFSLVKWRLRAE